MRTKNARANMTKQLDVTLHLTCDAADKIKEKSRCLYWCMFKESSIEECDARAQEDGWHIDGNTVICPRCRAQIKKESTT